MTRRLPFDRFLECVRDVPLVAIDLIVEDADGRCLLGRRTIRPAAGSWFVPGGRILKGETLAEAFARIARDELAIEASIGDAEFLGVHEHFYDDNAGGVEGFGTHYVVLGYRLGSALDPETPPRDQHDAYRWWDRAALLDDDRVHEHAKRYFRRDP